MKVWLKNVAYKKVEFGGMGHWLTNLTGRVISKSPMEGYGVDARRTVHTGRTMLEEPMPMLKSLLVRDILSMRKDSRWKYSSACQDP